MTRTIPPQTDELELSLFGAGIGECLVVHLAGGDWMVVDSCMNAAGDRSVALEYLEQLGVDVGSQVKLVVVTHWHDDHVRGIAQVLRYATSARFACSAALDSEGFFALVAADEGIKLVSHTSGVSEFADVLKVLDSRNGGCYRSGPDHWACDGMRLYYADNPNLVQVHALSPSSQTQTDARGGVARSIPSVRQVIRPFNCTAPNDLSVALLVSANGLNLLLGADLERGGDKRRGWRAVLSSSEFSPRALSRAYKVAHHGSENADLDGIWSDLLTGNPRAVLTPYARGPKPRPSPEDVSRIKKKTSNLYCTAWPPTKSPPSRDKAVERTMKEVALSHRAIRKRPGLIRVRAHIHGNPKAMTVELFDGAMQL